MAMIEQRRKGVIIEYRPCIHIGEILDEETKKSFRFHCQHIRSFSLREKLFNTNRFGNIDVLLKPNLPVTFCICENANQKQAGRIEPANADDLRRDLTAPSVGYVQSFSSSRSSAAKMAGWINPTAGSFDENSSVWFDIANVADPVLKNFLQMNVQGGKPFWVRREMRVRYWHANVAGNPTSAICVEMSDDSTRRRLIQQYRITSPDAFAPSILGAPPKVPVMPYVELPLPVLPITAEEQQMLLRFKGEAYRVTAREPAIQNRLDTYWSLLGRGQKEKVLRQFEVENNLKGTKVAKLCEAACCYLDQEYASALMCCVNAGSYDFGAELALHLNEYAVAQRMAEKNLSQEYQSERTRLLMRAAEHTGSADGICALFEEYLEDEDFYGEICDELCEEGQLLLHQRGVKDAFEMEGDEVCEELARRFNARVPELNELLAQLLKKERGDESAADSGDEQSEAPAAALPEKSPEELRAEFAYAFRTDSGYRVPDRAADAKYLPMLDALLKAPAANVADYRIPLLIRVVLDGAGSAPAIEHYMKQLADEQTKKRKKPDRDRRYRLFDALLAFVKAQNAADRAAALAKADKEKNGPDETALLAALNG